MLANLRVRSPVVIAVLACAVLLPGCTLLRHQKKSPEAAYAERPVDPAACCRRRIPPAFFCVPHLWVNNHVIFFHIVQLSILPISPLTPNEPLHKTVALEIRRLENRCSR